MVRVVSPALRLALVMLLALLGTSACAGRNARARASKERQDLTPHVFRGRVTFEASFALGREGKQPLDPASLVPTGHTGLPLLRVCAVRQVGWNDLSTERALVDDEILGCAVTDEDGRFRLSASTASCPRGGDCSRTVYLATDLCAWSGGRPEACVTTNALHGPTLDVTSWDTRREYRKLLWTRPIAVALRDEASTWSWNLSCPLERGSGESDVTCARTEQWGRNHRTASNVGRNVEAVHLYFSTARTILRAGSLRPTPSTTDRDDQGTCGAGGPADKRRRCNDVVRVVLREARNPFWRADRACERMWKVRKDGDRDFYLALRSVCIGTIRDPFVVSHELGHVLHARWLDITLGLMQGAAPKWRESGSEKASVAEGFANFVAVMTWYPRDAQDPRFVFGRVETPRTAPCGAAPAGEGPLTAFFWDLWDETRADEPEDTVEADFATIMRVWSRFPGGDRGTGEHGAVECGPDGRNLLDYAHHWERKGKLPRLTPLLRAHCLDRQRNAYACTAR